MDPALESDFSGKRDAMDDPITCSLGNMGPLLAQLRSLTDTERSLPQGISKDELQGLIQDLEEINTSVMDLAKEEDLPSTDKCWMKEVREISYDAEDYLETVMHAGAGSRKIPWILTKMKRQQRPLIAKDISEFRARLKDENERRERCELADLRARLKEDVKERRKRYQPALAGFKTIVESVLQAPHARPDEPMNELVSLLAFDRDQKLKVVPIVGSPGVGKTTLARRLYHQYGGRFQCRAFLRVSRNPDPRRLLTSTLSQIKGPRPHGSCDVQDLTDNINKHLLGKTYFIIVDDLWDASVWDIIRHAFPTGNCCSRIITTTQIEVVALACCSYYSENIYKMIPPSNDDQSQQLFFGNLEEVENLIYNDLPPHLKICLLYLSIYPEDYTIRKDDLVKQWVAEGFVSAVDGQDIEEVAGGYFGELVTRGMIQPADTNDNDEVVSCTVHHMGLDFITYKSMEENFVTIVDYFEAITGLPDKVRRLSMKLGGVKSAQIQGNFRMSQVRSLIFFGFFKCVPSIVGYKLLRVLILHIWTDRDTTSIDLAKICELFLLRYLKIECNMTVKLPTKILGLQYLGTLEIDARVTAIPSDIVCLQRLWHLSLPSEADLPNGIGCMTSLRSLGYFNLSTSSRENVLDLGKLTKLRDLHITCCTVTSKRLVRNMELLASILGGCSSLKSLVLDGGASSSKCISCDDGLGSMSTPPAILERLELSPRICMFSSLPRWIEKLDKLCVLKIALGELSRDEINILKGLNALAALSLYVRTAPAERIVFYKEGFPVLKHFKFICSALCLAFEKGAMPKVRRLKLGFNAERIEQYSPANAGFENLTGLEVFTAKIGCASADESGRKAVQSALEDAFRNCESRPVINVLWVDWIFYGDKQMSTVVQTEQPQTLGKADVITKGGSYEQHRTGEKGSTEGTDIQADSGITQASELPSHTQISGSPGLPMNPVSIAAGGWGIPTASWLVPTIFSKLLLNGFSYLGSRSSDKVKELERKVLKLKLMLEAADEANYRRGMTERWTTHLKSAFYEAEDILDAIDYHHLQSHVLHQTMTRRKQQGAEIIVPRLLRTKLEGTLKEIEILINEGHEFLSLFNLPVTYCNINTTPDTTVGSPTTTTSIPPAVFGQQQIIAIIRKMLRQTPIADEPNSSRTKCYSVIGIYGIPGSGKTTLAQRVCEHEMEDGYFNLFMWIHVSQNFSVDTVLAEMLEISSGEQTGKFSNLHLLQSKLEENLKGNRFLLVLDDFWSQGVIEQRLDQLLSPLMVGEMGSKILVTTRFADAARALGAQNPVPMPEMDKDQYLLMFMHYALDDAMISDQALLRELKLIGRKIAEKLGGSPLVARTVAGQLRRRPDINFWRRFLNRDLLNNETLAFLLWSYQQLEDHVKQCFKYCSMFPRRYELEREELVHMWMAQGFVDTEDIGHNCFDVLLSCSFIQPRGKGPYFTINYLMHHLAERVAGNDCFRFEKKVMVDRIPQEVRHLFIESHDKSVFSEKVLKLKTLRSIFVVSDCVQEMTKKDWEKLLMNLKKLRVVHVSGWKGEIPEYIGELKHLRYLSVSGSGIEMILPQTFCKLYHLHKFSAPHCNVDFSFVKEMSNLVNLQYIKTQSTLNFPDIGRMTWLRTLPIFTVRKRRGYEIQQLEHLDNLQDSLHIEGLENVNSRVEARQAKLVNKVHVSNLVLRWTTDVQRLTEDDQKSEKPRRTPEPQDEVLEALRPPPLVKSLVITHYSGSTYPSWLLGEQCNLENLQYLLFSYCYRLDAPPRIREFLVNLRVLGIYNCSWHSLPENMERLTSLEELSILDCKNILSLPRLPSSLKTLRLMSWNGSVAPPEITEFLVNLRALLIVGCSFHTLPEKMEHLTSLEELTIQDCKNILSLPRLPLSLKRLHLIYCNRSLTERCLADPNLKKIVRISKA